MYIYISIVFSIFYCLNYFLYSDLIAIDLIKFTH